MSILYEESNVPHPVRMPEQDAEDYWLCEERSFWLTWSLLFMAVPLWIGWNDRATMPDWSNLYWGALLFFIGLGLIQFLFGIFVSSGRIQGWCNSFSSNDGAFALAFLAVPLHLVLKLFFKSDD